MSQGGSRQDDVGATRIAVGLLIATLVSALLLVAAARIGVPDEARPAAHPAFAAMQHGGDGSARTGPVLVLGALFGFVQIAYFGLCFALGVRRHEGLGPLRRPLLAGLAAYAAVWGLLVWTYVDYAAAPTESMRVLGFPLPTAVLLFGFWPVPVVFAWIYLRHFDWIVDEERIDRFRARLAELRDEAPR